MTDDSIDPLVDTTEARINQLWFGLKRDAQPTLDGFARAYFTEFQRINADLAPGETPQAVGMHWLALSGWGGSVRAAVGDAAAQGAEQSLAIVLQAEGSAALAGDTQAMELIQQALQPAADLPGVDPRQLAPQSALDTLEQRFSEQPLARLFNGFSADAAARAQQALMTALALGDNPRSVAGPLADILDISRARALTIARTEMLGAYRDAQLANYRANSDVVAQWLWNADPDNRTCAACIAMDGTIHPLDEEMDSHPNCRCSADPVTGSWDSILGPLGIDTSDMLDTSANANYQTGADWFASQDAATQQSILGPAAFNAWQSGDVQFQQFAAFNSDGQLYQPSLKSLGLDARDYLGRDMGAARASVRDAEAAVAREAAASPLGTVDDILARQAAMERLYDVPMGDPTSLQIENPEAAAIGQADMQKMLSTLSNELQDNGAYMRLARYYGADKDAIDGWMTIWESEQRAMAAGREATDAEDELLRGMTRAEAQAWAKQKSLDGALYDMFEAYHSAPTATEGAITVFNSDPFQVALNEAARREFGLSAAHDYYTDEQLAAALDRYGKFMNGMRALLRQMYTDTQEYFADQGITEVQIFRGVRWMEGAQPGGIAWDGSSATSDLSAQPLASWASNAEVAYGYATGSGFTFFGDEAPDYSMVLATTVPVDQVLSFGYTGLGSTPLRELIMLSGDYQAQAVSFGADGSLTLDELLQALSGE